MAISRGSTGARNAAVGKGVFPVGEEVVPFRLAGEALLNTSVPGRGNDPLGWVIPAKHLNCLALALTVSLLDPAKMKAESRKGGWDRTGLGS